MSDVLAFIAGFYVLFFIVATVYAYYEATINNRVRDKKTFYVVVPTECKIALSLSIVWLVAYFFVIGK